MTVVGPQIQSEQATQQIELHKLIIKNIFQFLAKPSALGFILVLIMIFQVGPMWMVYSFTQNVDKMEVAILRLGDKLENYCHYKMVKEKDDG